MTRKGIAYTVLLLLFIISACVFAIASTWLFSQKYKIEVVQLSDLATNNYQISDSGLVDSVRKLDTASIKESTNGVIEFVAKQQADEETRLVEAQERAEQQQEFYEQLAELRRQQAQLQEQLDEKALKDIESMGGIDATSGNISVRDSELVKNTPAVTDDIEEAPVRSGTTSDGISDDATSGQDTGEHEDVSTEVNTEEVTAEPVYYGQFRANIVCTCAACFDPEKWKVADSGDVFILADTEFIEPGTRVVLDQGISAVFEVRDANGLVTGRNVIVFDNNHSEVGGGMQLYPRITEYIPETTDN